MRPLLASERERIAQRAAELGFVRVGFARAARLARAEAFERWLDDGLHGDMEYMARHRELRVDPSRIEPWAKSVVMLAAPYALPAGSDPAVSHYARGDDYHDVIRARLQQLGGFATAETGAHFRPAVDSAPLLERAIAEDAGLGWFGKSAMLLHPDHGSAFFVAALVLDRELDESTTPHPDRCGSCTRCIDACPTGAIIAPGRVDARRCVSYLTIELRGPIPRPLRPLVGHRIFGCDVCQTVCPWNRSRPRRPLADPLGLRARLEAREAWQAPSLAWILALDEAEFLAATRGTALRRTRHRGLLRNALVAAGNAGDPSLRASVAKHAESDDELLREHARWALARIDAQIDARGAARDGGSTLRVTP
jgi:epoxyqueuosine reductase